MSTKAAIRPTGTITPHMLTISIMVRYLISPPVDIRDFDMQLLREPKMLLIATTVSIKLRRPFASTEKAG